MNKLKTTIIGLGKQTTEDHIPAVVENLNLQLDSIVDTDDNKVNLISNKFKVDGFTNIEDVIKSKKT